MLSPATSECCPLNLVPATSVRRSLPARLAVGSNAITVCAVDTPPRLQRPIAESRHDCSDSSHLSSINDVTPSAFDIETQCSTYRGDFHSWQILCQQVSGVLLSWDFEHLNFASSNQVLKATALQHRCVGSSQGLFSGRSPCTHCCRSKLGVTPRHWSKFPSQRNLQRNQSPRLLP